MMAAYTAVISLLQTLEQLQQRNQKLIHHQTAKMLEPLHATAEYFQNVLEETSNKSRFDPEKAKSLEEKIRAAASDAEDVVELKIWEIVKGSSWKLQHEDLQPFVEKMDTTKKQVMEIVSNFSTSIHDSYDEIVEIHGDSLIGPPSRSNPMLPNLEDDIVQGLDNNLEIIVGRLKGPPSDLEIVTISGMGGIGKTTLARKAYDHLSIRYHFDILAWVTISQEYRAKKVLLEALYCISKQTFIVNARDYDKMDDSELADLVQKNLKGRRYLVVVDDIWSINAWDSIRGIFPNYNNGSRVLLTTRETELAMYANPTSPHEMNLLNLATSWKLLRDKVFGPEHDHPPELEETGKKIVEKCQGLPLTISVIAGYLSKMARTLESWKDVARNLGDIIASHPNKCLGVLSLSYHHLPNRLKPCFLSMGSFPEDFQVETCKLIQLWIAEGFIRTSESVKSLEEVAEIYLEELIGRNLIMARKRRFNGEIKTCEMHDLLREFCLTEVEMTKFMHVQRTDIVPAIPAQKHNVHRFSFQTRGYSVDDCCKLLSPVVRSLYLFYSFKDPFLFNPLAMFPIHDLVEQAFSSFNHIRVLALFHESDDVGFFPLVITKLFHLRYLAVKCYGGLPASISALQNLQTLIQEKFRAHNTPLPMKIWAMKNLRLMHLGTISYLPNPRRNGIRNKHMGMPNLEELFGLCSTSCTNKVFSGIPNLKRLIIHQTPASTKRRDNHFIDMSSLTKLDALKCYNYNLPCTIKRFVFPTSLKRLSFNGCFSFPWADISTLVMLPNLEELKLKDYAVKGEVWRLSDEDKFESLKLLVFSGLYLERWEASSDSFPNLKRLVLKKCFILKEIPIDFGEICSLESIELHNCSIAAEDSATIIEQEQADMGNDTLKVSIQCSRMRD